MAGSGFRPLPNIPYCCLPQESGPCLSASVGDRPLRSPTHRRPGGPSPRLLSNGTHARPPPRRRFALQGMPPKGPMADCPAFPPAVRRRGVGCIRVAHPSATLAPPKGRLPSDLHVLGLPPAFILSQDQTLRCTIVSLLSSVSQVPLRCIKGSFPPGPAPLGATRAQALVLASDYQRTPQKLSPHFHLCFPELRTAKIRPFSILAIKKRIIFE